MSELRTNRIVPRDGLASGVSGGIIQIKQSVLTSATHQNIDAGSNYDWSGFTCAITPKRSDSKIMIMAMLSLVMENGSAGFLKIKRKNADLKNIMMAEGKLLLFLTNSHVLVFNTRGNLEKVNKLPGKMNTFPILIENKILFLDKKNKLTIVN